MKIVFSYFSILLFFSFFLLGCETQSDSEKVKEQAVKIEILNLILASMGLIDSPSQNEESIRSH